MPHITTTTTTHNNSRSSNNTEFQELASNDVSHCSCSASHISIKIIKPQIEKNSIHPFSTEAPIWRIKFIPILPALPSIVSSDGKTTVTDNEANITNNSTENCNSSSKNEGDGFATASRTAVTSDNEQLGRATNLSTSTSGEATSVSRSALSPRFENRPGYGSLLLRLGNGSDDGFDWSDDRGSGATDLFSGSWTSNTSRYPNSQQAQTGSSMTSTGGATNKSFGIGKIVGHQLTESGGVKYKLHWTGGSESSEDDAWVERFEMCSSARGEQLVMRYERDNKQELRALLLSVEQWRHDIIVNDEVAVQSDEGPMVEGIVKEVSPTGDELRIHFNIQYVKCVGGGGAGGGRRAPARGERKEQRRRKKKKIN